MRVMETYGNIGSDSIFSLSPNTSQSYNPLKSLKKTLTKS